MATRLPTAVIDRIFSFLSLSESYTLARSCKLFLEAFYRRFLLITDFEVDEDIFEFELLERFFKRAQNLTTLSFVSYIPKEKREGISCEQLGELLSLLPLLEEVVLPTPYAHYIEMYSFPHVCKAIQDLAIEGYHIEELKELRALTAEKKRLEALMEKEELIKQKEESERLLKEKTEELEQIKEKINRGDVIEIEKIIKEKQIEMEKEKEKEKEREEKEKEREKEKENEESRPTKEEEFKFHTLLVLTILINCTNLTRLTLSSLKLKTRIFNTNKFEKLGLSSVEFQLEENILAFDGIEMPLIESLSLTGCDGITPECLNSLNHCKKLRRFNCSYLEFPSTLLETIYFPEIKSLKLGEGIEAEPKPYGNFLARHFHLINKLKIGNLNDEIVDIIRAQLAIIIEKEENEESTQSENQPKKKRKKGTTKTLTQDELLEGRYQCEFLQIGEVFDNDEPISISNWGLEQFLSLFSSCEMLSLCWLEDLTTISMRPPLWRQLKTLTIYGLTNYNMNHLSKIASSSDLLRRLEVEYCGTNDPKKVKFESQSLIEIILPVESISSVYLGNCPKLKKLQLNSEDFGGSLKYVEVRGPCPKLETIDVSYVPLGKKFWQKTLPCILKYAPDVLLISVSKVTPKLLELVRKDKFAYLFLWNWNDNEVNHLSAYARQSFQAVLPEFKAADLRQFKSSMMVNTRKIFKKGRTSKSKGYVETNVPEFLFLYYSKASQRDITATMYTFLKLVLMKKLLIFSGSNWKKQKCPF